MPQDWTRDRAKVTVRFQSPPGGIAGGVSGLRVSRASAASAAHDTAAIVF